MCVCVCVCVRACVRACVRVCVCVCVYVRVLCTDMETGKRKMFCVRKRGTQEMLTDVINKGKAFKNVQTVVYSM